MNKKKIMLYLFQDEYDWIQEKCFANKVSMNRFFQDYIRGQMKNVLIPEKNIVEAKPLVTSHLCEMCKKPTPATGKFKFMVYEDTDRGEYEEEMYLCGFHKTLRKAYQIED